MLREIRDLGFEFAELSHGTRISLLPGILEAVDAGEIKDLECSQFLPASDGGKQLSTEPVPVLLGTERERDLAKRYTIKTLEIAARVKAPSWCCTSGAST